MPRTRQNDAELRKKYAHKHDKEFYETKSGLLWCRVCDKSINYNKKSVVQQHRLTKTHLKNLFGITNTENPIKACSMDTFKKDLVTVFLNCDIPLNKLRYKKLQEFFKQYDLPLVSQSTACNQVKELGEENRKKIIDKIKDKFIFIIIDESFIKDKYCVNILIGDIQNPNQSYLLDCMISEEPVNSDFVVRAIDNLLVKEGVQRSNFCLLLSDAAKYMTKAAGFLHVLFPNLFHMTCLSHLMHNFALKIKSYFTSTNNLISAMKNLVVKNKRRRKLFQRIGCPPTPIITRWQSWLNAAKYYYTNLTEVKRIVAKIDTPGKIVNNAISALNQAELVEELRAINSYHEVLNPISTLLEEKRLNIQEEFGAIDNIEFRTDLVGLKGYITKRLTNNEIYKIIHWRVYTPNIDLRIIDGLMSCQCTSVDVERSFSMLNKLMADNRDFKDDNIKYYIMSYYNKDI